MASRNHETNAIEVDGAFERLLLDSAKDDALPGSASRAAWQRFASSAAAMTHSAQLGTGAVPVAGLGRSARVVAMKWLAIGAIGGSGITVAWLGPRHTTPLNARTQMEVSPPSVAPLVPSASPPTATAPVEVEATSTLDDETVSPARDRNVSVIANPKKPERVFRQKAKEPNLAASSLREEVALLDTVRTALSIGAFDEALRLVDEYHREFPGGQLAPDAEARAIEALHAQGAGLELSRRVDEFLRRYPNDPHADRVRALGL